MWGASSATNLGFTVHFVPMMVDRGLFLTLAGILLGSMALMSLTGRLGLAWLGDIVSKRYLMVEASCRPLQGVVS